MGTVLNAIEYFLPESIVTNDDLKRENPDWNMEAVEAKTGVLKRHIANQNETAFDLSKRLCDKVLAKNPFYFKNTDGVIYCTQSPDYIMPPNSCLLHDYLNLPDTVFAYDFNLACSGYVYGLAMAHGFIKSGLSRKIVLINADTYSKFINKRDRSTRVLFGDGASITTVEKSESKTGIIDIDLATSGKNFRKFFIPAGGCRLPNSAMTTTEGADEKGNTRSQKDIYMDGIGVWAFINSVVPTQIQNILMRNKLTFSDINLFIFHQASKFTLDSLVKLLKIDRDRVFVNIAEIGNTVSASIPIALKDAIDLGKISDGDKVLLSGFGVGMSYATMLIEF